MITLKKGNITVLLVLFYKINKMCYNFFQSGQAYREIKATAMFLLVHLSSERRNCYASEKKIGCDKCSDSFDYTVSDGEYVHFH
jgi:hypothetical protein